MGGNPLRKWLGIFFLILLVNAGYIWAFASPTVFYMGNVLIHLCLGTVLFLAFIGLFAMDSTLRRGTKVAALFFTVAFGFGAYLAYAGLSLDRHWALWAHIAAALLGVGAVGMWVARTSRMQMDWVPYRKAFGASVAVLVLLPALTTVYNKVVPGPYTKISNPHVVPTSMQEEGAGPKSPFYPSSANTNVNGIIPSNFFMDSKACGECHKDIYDQWNSSAHHFSSFNNQYYRKAIEYMQDVVGTQPSKWCAGCHDHAVFFNGRFDKPIKEQIDTPEAHAGLACTSCHSIVNVNGSMGNGGFTIEYPPLHQYMTSDNKYIKAFNHFLTNLNPEPHKRSFMKPFMRTNTSEFCSSCHKVHLDVPVNEYRWFRGFNDYDNWQASGFGQGARSFYYPPQGATCGGCHMPKIASKDPGNVDGMVHNHRFPGGNTAVPTANQDEVQLKTVEDFLKSGFISVDIFGVSPIEEGKNQTAMVRRMGEGPQAMSAAAQGEETEQAGVGVIREVGKLSAPIDQAGAKLKPGSMARVDVVVRTRKIGHAFPGGTLDSFDIWLELQGKDADGKMIYWSGNVQEDGAVDPGAHFYKSYQLDAEGNPINKRNAWQARSVLYVRAIGPGSADVGHFRVKIPKDVKGPISLTAKLNYRKFGYYANFAYAGQPKPGQSPDLINKHYNSAEYSFDANNIPKNVSGKIKDRIPQLPIVVLAQAETKLLIGDSKTETEWKPVVRKADRERWNDWGIGLLQQGDLKGAEYAFRRTTEAEPGYADGWLNAARALIQEGETDAAKPFIEKALSVDSKLGRIWYFKALIQKTDGDYDGAIQSLQKTAAIYPRDRVVQNQIARVLFLKREYKAALDAIEKAIDVDPEDLQAHYTAMLCYRGLQQPDKAAREQKLFERFKAEEAAQSITGKRRLVSPEDNNERQQIHDHESIAFTKQPVVKKPELQAKASGTAVPRARLHP
ncbi:MAG: tetratricopeptide repeat protein [Bryobacteraceae bacterium]